jgi:SAM-dependent methyltransferase
MTLARSDLDPAVSIYTPRKLALYDHWVHGFSNQFIWKCPTPHLQALYQAHLSPNHLEVGPGTGYFLAKELPSKSWPRFRLALLDLNQNCLDYSRKRLAAYHPELIHGNILDELPLRRDHFDSMAINYVLHCLPGTLDAKAVRVFDQLIPWLNNDGVIFGSTILGSELTIPFLATRLMNFYNDKGIFCNAADRLGAIMETLSARFRTVYVEVHGCVVLFWGKGLKDAYRH